MEIIIPSLFKEPLLDVLDTAKITGYSVLNNVEGSGEQGDRFSDGVSSVMDSSLFIVVCEMAEFSTIRQPLLDLLTECRGMCLVTEVELLGD
jgi:hypothetical protein